MVLKFYHASEQQKDCCAIPEVSDSVGSAGEPENFISSKISGAAAAGDLTTL